jgi:hypothetical protein
MKINLKHLETDIMFLIKCKLWQKKVNKIMKHNPSEKNNNKIYKYKVR